MPGFLNVRVAPGLRVSASGRGLRAHVGPRAARLHTGAGRTGASTGAGPFTYYKSLHSSEQQRSQGSSAPTGAAEQKAAEAEHIRLELAAIQSLHRYEFPTSVREMAELPVLPKFTDLLEAAEREHLRGIGLFSRQQRAEARTRARQATEQHCRILLARARRDQARQQARLDDGWNALLANDESAVLATLESVFEDDNAPAAALRVGGGTAFVAVLIPGAESLPERLPTITSAGNLSLKKMTKSQRASWYLPLVAGHVVATAKEAIAACPGLDDVTVVALRHGAGGTPSPVLATNLSRSAMSQVSWGDLAAWDVIDRFGSETRVRFKGIAREMADLDLSEEPSLKPVLDAF